MEINLDYSSTGTKDIQKRVWIWDTLIWSIYYRKNWYSVLMRELIKKDYEFPDVEQNNVAIKKEIDTTIKNDLTSAINWLLDWTTLNEIKSLDEIKKIKLTYKQLEDNKGNFSEAYVGVFLWELFLASISYSEVGKEYMLRFHTLPAEEATTYFRPSKLWDIKIKKECVTRCEEEGLKLFKTFLKPSSVKNIKAPSDLGKMKLN